MRVHHAERERDRDGGIDRVAPVFQDIQPGLRSQRMDRRHGPMRAMRDVVRRSRYRENKKCGNLEERSEGGERAHRTANESRAIRGVASSGAGIFKIAERRDKPKGGIPAEIRRRIGPIGPIRPMNPTEAWLRLKFWLNPCVPASFPAVQKRENT